jgi:hypothetical protein
MTTDVPAFLDALEHPHKDAIVALRAIILDADPSIDEGIKWNAPSFRTSEYFATFHLRAKKGVQMILHRGAKKREGSVTIDDPDDMLEWLGADRASVVFADLDDVERRRATFASLIRSWITHV